MAKNKTDTKTINISKFSQSYLSDYIKKLHCFELKKQPLAF